MSVDTATLPVICLGASTGDDVVDSLISFVRQVIFNNVTLDGEVPSCLATSERNWRAVRIGGADMLAADVVLTIQT